MTKPPNHFITTIEIETFFRLQYDDFTYGDIIRHVSFVDGVRIEKLYMVRKNEHDKTKIYEMIN